MLYNSEENRACCSDYRKEKDVGQALSTHEHEFLLVTL